MLGGSEAAGFLGAALAGAAYVPQISHLIRKRCSAGISRAAFGVWLAASLLVTTRAIAIRASVFIVLGVIQIVATALICIYAKRYEHARCDTPCVMSSGSDTAQVGEPPTWANETQAVT